MYCWQEKREGQKKTASFLYLWLIYSGKGDCIGRIEYQGSPTHPSKLKLNELVSGDFFLAI